MVESNSKAVESITIDERNIIVNLVVEDRVELIRRLGGLLFQNGFVKDTFIQAVLDREVVFPTGLQTNILGVAIPHTDSEHVIKSAIAIATLAKPVIFQEMGSPESYVPVSIVMMLAVGDPKSVIPVLRSVLYILENGEALEALIKANSSLEIKDVVQNQIQLMASLLLSESTTGNMD